MTTLTGTVVNGVVVFDGGPPPDGTKVRVDVREAAHAVGSNGTPPDEADTPTLIGLLDLAGKLDDLPPDFAAQHDHYIHGTPKR